MRQRKKQRNKRKKHRLLTVHARCILNKPSTKRSRDYSIELNQFKLEKKRKKKTKSNLCRHGGWKDEWRDHITHIRAHSKPFNRQLFSVLTLCILYHLGSESWSIIKPPRRRPTASLSPFGFFTETIKSLIQRKVSAPIKGITWRGIFLGVWLFDLLHQWNINLRYLCLLSTKRPTRRVVCCNGLGRYCYPYLITMVTAAVATM